MSKKSTIVPLADAVEWTSNFRKTMKKGDAKAFLFHASTMVDILKEMQVIKDNGKGDLVVGDTDDQCLRAYMAVDQKQAEANGQKLVFVGTKKDAKGVYRDMLPSKTNKSSDGGDLDGNVYNFTKPCPMTCDDDSQLGG